MHHLTVAPASLPHAITSTTLYHQSPPSHSSPCLTIFTLTHLVTSHLTTQALFHCYYTEPPTTSSPRPPTPSTQPHQHHRTHSHLITTTITTSRSPYTCPISPLPHTIPHYLITTTLTPSLPPQYHHVGCQSRRTRASPGEETLPSTARLKDSRPQESCGGRHTVCPADPLTSFHYPGSWILYLYETISSFVYMYINVMPNSIFMVVHTC